MQLKSFVASTISLLCVLIGIWCLLVAIYSLHTPIVITGTNLWGMILSCYALSVLLTISGIFYIDVDNLQKHGEDDEF